MFFEYFKNSQQIDHDIKQQERDLENLAQQMNLVKRKNEKLFSSLGIPPEEIEQYFDNPDNFTKEAWGEFSKLRLKIESDANRLDANMVSVEDKSIAYKNYAELRESYAWIKD